MDFQENDKQWMERALQLGERARLLSPPNPWVGCVLVKNQQVVGEGHTLPPGKAHAEAAALQQAGSQAAGSTAYITLEPCSHFGKTPPCANALIQAGVIRAFVGIEDPDSQVAGRGIQLLREAGVEVKVGLLADKIAEQLKAYLYHRQTGRPFCLLKTAISLDGRTVAADGESQWITTPEAKQDLHRLRTECQAILVGAGTAIKDQPALTIRETDAKPLRPLLRCIADSQGRTPPTGPLFDTALAPTCVLTTANSPTAIRSQWEEKGAEVVILGSAPDQSGVDLVQGMDWLGKQGVLQVMVEGGACLHENLWKQGLVNELVVYVGPRLLGASGRPFLNTLQFPHLATAPLLTLTDIRQLGQTVRLIYATQGTAANDKDI